MTGFVTRCSLLALRAVTAMISQAQTVKTLHRFCTHTGCTAQGPNGGIIQATDGFLYGTAIGGGDGPSTAYKLTPGGNLTVLTDLSGPNGGLVQATDGYLYGTTQHGGANFLGSVFKMSPGGTVTTLYSFCSQSNCSDGEFPRGALVQATNGDLYGTTPITDPLACSRIMAQYSKSLRAAHSRLCTPFASKVDALTAVIRWETLAVDGDIYGTTAYGGATGNGTIFRITPDGTLNTVYNFCVQAGCPDGSSPFAGLMQGTDGKLYGTTSDAGTLGNGTAFGITPGGTLTTLYHFCSLPACADGNGPGALMQATDGNFYGVSASGGAYGQGTIFSMTTSGTLTTLYNFCSQGFPSGYTDGSIPVGPLVQDTSGVLYGSTANGKNVQTGTIFILSVGLGPFIKKLPASGTVGSSASVVSTK